MAEKYQEGQQLKGSDGKIYVVVGGVPREQIAGPSVQSGVYRLPKSPEKAAEEERKAGSFAMEEEAAERARRSEKRDIESKEFSQIGSLRTEFLGIPEVKEFRQVRNATRQIIDLTSKGTPIANIGSVFSLMKILDPGSTVREGEAASVQNAAGVPDRFRNAYNQLLSGQGLSETQRKDMADVARSIYNQRLTGYNDLATTYRGLMADQGADPDKQGITLETPFEMEGAAGDRATQLQDAFNKGSSLQELNALASKLGISPNQDDLLKAIEFRDSGRVGARILPPESGAAPEETGFFEGIIETVTGSERSTPEIEALPEWTTMPELNELSVAGARTGIGTMFTSPEESVKIIQSNYPGVQVRQDSKGNYILRSQDGQEYGIKPGFRWSDVPRALGGILAFTPAGRATTVAGSAGGAALTQAGIEATQAGAGGTFDTGEIAIAGGAGAAGKVLEQALPAVVSSVRGMRGGPAAALPESAPAPTAPAMEALAAPATPRQIIEAGEQANIPVMTSDIRPPETFMGTQMQRIGERIPIIGTGGPRATQQQARQEAVKDFILENAGAVPADVEERIVADVLRKRGAVVEKYTNLKDEVFSNLAGAGEVAVNNTVKAIDDQIAELSKARTPAADEAIAKLTDIRNQAVGRDIRAMEAFRRDVLGKAWQDEGMSVGASDRVKSAVQNLYGPFNEDMGKFIIERSGKRDYTKWRVANARLSDGIQEAKRSTLKNILRSGEATPEVINNMLFSGKKSDVAALYRSLTPEGKAQARMAIVQRIAKDMGAETGDISPEKFLTQIRKRSDQLGVFFEKGQQEELKGLARVLSATRRAGGAGVATPTGQENFPLLLGALGMGDVFTTGGIGTAIGLTFAGGVRAYESKAVRNLLAALGKTKSGSPAEMRIMDNLSGKLKDALPASVPAAATQMNGQSQAAPDGIPMVRTQ
jgi:hypothetical protein